MCVGVCDELALALALGWEPCEEEVEEVAPVVPEFLPLVWAAASSGTLPAVAEDMSMVMEIHPCREGEGVEVVLEVRWLVE